MFTDVLLTVLFSVCVIMVFVFQREQLKRRAINVSTQRNYLFWWISGDTSLYRGHKL